MSAAHLKEAQKMADKVTCALTGAGIWGVEFFLSKKNASTSLSTGSVYFSELSPRPHDTGMVTLAGTQNFSEFELHARAVLGLPIPEIVLERAGASAVVLASKDGINPTYTGIEKAISQEQTDIKIFGKPTTRLYRRMAVCLAWGKKESDVMKVKQQAIANAKKVKVGAESALSLRRGI